MKFFIDTANFDEIKEAHSWGILSGVTTNPSLVAKEKNVSLVAGFCWRYSNYIVETFEQWRQPRAPPDHATATGTADP